MISSHISVLLLCVLFGTLIWYLFLNNEPVQNASIIISGGDGNSISEEIRNSNTQRSQALFSFRAPIEEVCTMLTAEEAKQYNVPEGAYICDLVPAWQDNPDVRWGGTVHSEPSPGVYVTKYILYNRDLEDLSVTLNNIKGTYRGIGLTFGSDFFSEGFLDGLDVEDEEKVTPAEKVTAMLNNVRNNTVMVLGKNALPSASASANYSFDVANPVAVSGAVHNNLQLLQNFEDPKQLNGVLRLYMEFVDYEFTVDGKEKVVRLALSANGANMADKLLKFGENDYRFYDLDNEVFVPFSEGRPARCCGMWRSGRADELLNEGDSKEEKDPMEDAMVSANETYAMPMPIEVTGDNIDFTLLSNEQKTHNIGIQLVVDGYVSMRKAALDNLVEADLSDADIVKRFNLPSISLRALLSITQQA